MVRQAEGAPGQVISSTYRKCGSLCHTCSLARFYMGNCCWYACCEPLFPTTLCRAASASPCPCPQAQLQSCCPAYASWARASIHCSWVCSAIPSFLYGRAFVQSACAGRMQPIVAHYFPQGHPRPCWPRRRPSAVGAMLRPKPSAQGMRPRPMLRWLPFWRRSRGRRRPGGRARSGRQRPSG